MSFRKGMKELFYFAHIVDTDVTPYDIRMKDLIFGVLGVSTIWAK